MLDSLRKIIRSHMNDYADDLAGGAAKDFAEYKYLTGIIAGLALAERELVDLQQRELRADFEE